MARLRRYAPPLLAALLLLTPLAPASAQNGLDRRGFWGNLTIASGQVSVTCAVCIGEAQSAIAGALSGGTAVTSRLLVGGELEMWRRGGDDVVQRVMSLSLVSHMYPVPTVPAFVKVGLGYMRYRASNDEDALHSGSLALRVGGGYDFPLRQRYVVTPVASFTHGFSPGLSLNDDQVTRAASIKMLQFGLGIGVR